VRVRATSRGYYLSLRDEGQIFEIEDETLLGSWMEVIEEQTEKPTTRKKVVVKKKAKAKSKAKA